MPFLSAWEAAERILKEMLRICLQVLASGCVVLLILPWRTTTGSIWIEIECRLLLAFVVGFHCFMYWLMFHAWPRVMAWIDRKFEGK